MYRYPTTILKYLWLGAVLFLGSVLLSCNPDTVPVEPPPSNDYTPSDSAVAFFLVDATDFAIAELSFADSAVASQVIVPPSVLNKYLHPLARLYDSQSTEPLLDTLITQKQIHSRTVLCAELLVKADTTYEWVKNLMQNVVPTGEPGIDSLMSHYDLEVKHVYRWSFASYASITFSHIPLNTIALGVKLSGVPGVTEAGPNMGVRYWTKLHVIPAPDSTIVRFYYGYGDCVMGCSGYERWTYSVYRDGAIKYDGYLHE